MDELVAWFRALLDDDRRAALYRLNTDTWTQQGTYEPDPDFVVAEIDAKLRILDTWETWRREGREAQADYSAWADGGGAANPPRRTVDERAGCGLEMAVQLLVLPYADRSGFDPRWAAAAPV